MKSPVILRFNEWLTFMEEAYDLSSKDEFRQLEDKIMREIAFSRKHPRKP